MLISFMKMITQGNGTQREGVCSLVSMVKEGLAEKVTADT